MKRNTVATYEMGRSVPSDAAMTLICREFNVNEEWLRTGQGEMYKELTGDDEVAICVSSLLENSENPFQSLIIDIVRTYCQLEPNSQKAVDQMINILVSDIKKK